MVDTFVFLTFADNVRVGDRMENGDMAEIASQTWARFAHDGNPNNELVPKWQSYDLDERATMIFDAPCHLERDPFPDMRTAWNADDFSM